MLEKQSEQNKQLKLELNQVKKLIANPAMARRATATNTAGVAKRPTSGVKKTTK